MDAALLEVVRAGRFADALARLRRHCSQTDPEDQVTLAELLERTGDLRSAKRVAHRLLSSATSPLVRTRALTLLGTIALEEGDNRESVQFLQEAVALAAKHRLPEQLCWAELRLLTALMESSPSEASATLVGTLRRHVNGLGDPVLTSALHLFVSECEAKRGALGTAARHAFVARALLQTHDNAWIDGLTATAEFCIAFTSDDLSAAHALAQEALASFRRTGHVRTKIAALINLGHTDLKQGNEDRAERYLRDVLSSPGLTTRVRDSVIEGLAQLELARGNLAASEAHIASLEASKNPELAYPKLWGGRTKARLMGALGRWQEALTCSDSALERANAAGDETLIALLRLQRAEASAQLGDWGTASSDFLFAATSQSEPPLEVLAEANRVLGRALLLQSDYEGAASALSRAIRIFDAVGNGSAARTVRNDVLGDYHLRQMGLGRGDNGARPDITARCAAALVQQASRPDLLGAEALRMLVTADAVAAAAVLASDAHGQIEIVDAIECSSEDAASLKKQSQLSISLGSRKGREWTLIAKPKPGIANATTWFSVRSLCASGVDLARAQLDARERQALWPIDNPDTQAPGVFIGEQMLELLRIARRIAASDSLVLLTGETGVGKDVLARTIHDASNRAGRPFVPFNCSAVPRDMVESQLFGHRRGAFTGAEHASPGVIRAAEGGTLFLDEIGEIPLDLQPKLLRFLDQREIHPLGEPQPSKVDVRVVAATNRQLDELVREGRFREDLYYRLLVITLSIPPLRERREEIPGLADHFLTRFSRESHKGRLRIADETMEYLVLHRWPGNVRQLMNELRRMATLAETDAVLMPEHLHHDIVSTRRTRPASERDLAPTEVVVRLDQPLAAATEHLERAIIQYAMGQCEGRLEQVAQLLGLSRKGLYLKRQRLGLEPEES